MAEIIEIPLSKLEISKSNVRKDLAAGQEDGEVEQLAASIRSKGLINPLTVRSLKDGRYEVVSGQRRLIACQQIRLDPVRCIVRDDLNDADAEAISLVENVQRADMHPMDKAAALKSLLKQKGSLEAVARETGWTTSTVKKYLNLLELPEQLQERLTTAEGSVGIGVMSNLAQRFDGEDAIEVYEKIAGFKGRIQDEIIKRSGGDIGKIDSLVDEAQEGAFDLRKCGGLSGCEVVRDILEGEISQDEFEQMVRHAAERAKSNISRSDLKSAARAFWKSLAVD